MPTGVLALLNLESFPTQNVFAAVPNEPVVTTPDVVVINGKLAVEPIAPALVIFPCEWLVSAAPISVRDQEYAAEPFTDLVVDPIVIFLAVPQVAVVIAEEPLNDVPLIFLAVAKVVAVPALPEMLPLIVLLKVFVPVMVWFVSSVVNLPEPPIAT